MATSSAPKQKKRRARRIRQIIYSILVILVVFLLLRYLVLRPAGKISVVENGAGFVFTPVQRVFSNVTEFFKSWFGTSGGTSDAEEL